MSRSSDADYVPLLPDEDESEGRGDGKRPAGGMARDDVPAGGAEADELPWMRLRGEDDVEMEISRHRAMLTGHDALGWTDADWFHYVHAQPADERQLPAGMPAATLDRGHHGMRLADFARHPTAVAAGLKRAHVLALRLYSGGVYRTINAALRKRLCDTMADLDAISLRREVRELRADLRAALGREAALQRELMSASNHIATSNATLKRNAATERRMQADMDYVRGIAVHAMSARAADALGAGPNWGVRRPPQNARVQY